MQAELIGHIGYLVLLVCLLGNLSQWPLTIPMLRAFIASLCQVAFEDLHQAVGIAMVMDWTPLPGGPYEHQLLQDVSEACRV